MRLLQHFRSLESFYRLHDLLAQTLVAIAAYFSHLSLEIKRERKIGDFRSKLSRKNFRHFHQNDRDSGRWLSNESLQRPTFVDNQNRGWRHNGKIISICSLEGTR